MQNAPRDRQPESRAAAPAFGRDQRLEDSLQQVGRNALAVVFDPNLDPFAFLLRCDPDVAMLANCVAGIEEDVGQNLLQLVKVPADAGFRDTVDVNRDFFRLQEVLVQSDGSIFFSR